ncbi:hypothetical protein [Corynebacterium antarcticum]|uniref:hypothetical protein n=1 Tax=Corynebacterium antarcticum TaxID=2800405 RepID=UPI0020030C3C|nr:hypothetical protein [Corynebacterium antarcticum]MCK7660050.1 hypothetical protein [Corynebacterium antarcticum]
MARNTSPDSLLVFGNRDKDITESVAAILTRVGKPHAVNLDTRRLRTTWIVTLMRDYVPDPIITAAAGLADLQHFAHYRTTPTTTPT